MWLTIHVVNNKCFYNMPNIFLLMVIWVLEIYLFEKNPWFTDENQSQICAT